MSIAELARVARVIVGLGACAGAAVLLAPAAEAEMSYGNYELRIPSRYDFHTWAWAVSPCDTADCRYVSAIPMPVAKAYAYSGQARLAEGRYTLTVDVPDGLRCGNVYYGPVIATRDTYSWDERTLHGTLESSFSQGCDGAPGGTYTYPITLVRM